MALKLREDLATSLLDPRLRVAMHRAEKGGAITAG